jgi:hypothetical protein
MMKEKGKEKSRKEEDIWRRGTEKSKEKGEKREKEKVKERGERLLSERHGKEKGK